MARATKSAGVELRVRPMDEADLDAGAAASAAAFGVSVTDPQAWRRWRQRVGHLLATDPDGAFVAERDGVVIGVAQALHRERLWVLSLLAVDPAAQSGGAGRVLFERCLAYSDAEHQLIVSSNDPRALRLYATAGFSVRPTLRAQGRADPRAVPREATRPGAGAQLRPGGPADLPELEAISRAVRGAAHTREIEYALDRGAEIVVHSDRGFVVAQKDQGLWLLVAHDEAAATALLWRGLAIGGAAEQSVRWITSGQDWAVRAVLAAGLEVDAYGALCVRGQPGPLQPFLPSAPFA